MGEDLRPQTREEKNPGKTNIILENKAAITMITASGTLYAITLLITLTPDTHNKATTAAALLLAAEAAGILGLILGGKNLINRLRFR